MAKAVVIFLLMFIGGCFASASNADRPVHTIYVDASGTTITAAAYVEVDAAMDAACEALVVHNETNQVLYLGVGDSGVEQKIPYTLANGGSYLNYLFVPTKKAVRLSARAVGADATTGSLIINCLQ